MQTTSHMTKIQAEAALSAWVPNGCLLDDDERRFGHSPTLAERCTR
jgi:hypothetical protein